MLMRATVPRAVASRAFAVGDTFGKKVSRERTDATLWQVAEWNFSRTSSVVCDL
jgi:hypothetical protein